MKNKPLWQILLTGADLVCVIGALICLMVFFFLGCPEDGTGILFRFMGWALMGVHFVLQGIAHWKDHRWLSVFEVGIVVFVLIFVMLRSLR